MRHFAATEAQGDLDLVAFLEEALHGLHLDLVIVIVDAGTQLDFLDLDGLLLLARLGGLLLLEEAVFAVVEDLADGRGGVRRDLHEVEAGVLGERRASKKGITPRFCPASSISCTSRTPRMSRLARGPSFCGTGMALIGLRMARISC